MRPSLAPGGCLVIQTFMRDRQPSSALFGVPMLVVGNGGDAHPERLSRQWLEATGYGPIEIEDGDDRSLLFAPISAAS